MALKFRRGTTAQKSGSLAFGEPYVNTDLGTLQIGGATGDITLGASGTGSTATFGAISGSGLDITGNANIAGNLTLGGNITIGDATTDNVVINADLSSSLIPNNDNAFDIGSTSARYRNIYANTISASSFSNLNTANPTNLAYYSSANKLTGWGNSYINSDTLGIGTPATSSAPERLVVESQTLNLATFQTSLQNSYAQVNIKNFGSGSNASADLVIWNDATTENSNYVDLGLNSSNYNGGAIGYGGDGYLYSYANDMYIGSALSGSHGHVHLFGGGLWSSSSISIYNDGTIGINTDKLNNSSSTIPTAGFAMEISGGVKFDNSIEVTGSVRATSFTGSIGATNGVVSGSSQITLSSTTGFGTYLNQGVLTSSNPSFNSVTSSVATGTAPFNVASTTVVTNLNADLWDGNHFAPLGTWTASIDTKNATLATYTASLETKNATLATYTSSNDSKWSTLGSLSGSFARTNSANIFNGNQTITGSLFVTQDLIVQGSSSIQNISSSNLVIGAAYVTVNTNSPSSRYAGLLIVDSGSAGSSGSFLYDAVDDEMIFVHKGNGTNVTSSQVLMGPETYDNLGNEIYLTKNRVVKGGGYEHLADSNINDDGTTISLNANTAVTGSLTVSGNITGPIRATNGVVSGSSQIVGSSITTNTVTVGTTAIALGGSSTTLAGLTSVSSTGFTGALTGNASTATTLQTARTINGTSFDGSANIVIPNLVSGSSQIVGSSITTNTVTFNGTAVALGGSGTITANTTNTLTIGTGLSGTSFNGSAAVTIANTGVTSNVAGTGISVSGATGAVTITNTGVTSITGTANQVVASASTGGVTLSLPQSINSTATPTFGNLTINGTITATGDITAYYTSDKRHKNNIQLIPNALEKVSKLNGVTWEWNDDVNEVTKSTPKTGLIAQEVQEVLPQVVVERENGYLGLDYSKMMGLLVEAIKEQQTQIHSLTLEIEKLKESKGL